MYVNPNQPNTTRMEHAPDSKSGRRERVRVQVPLRFYVRTAVRFAFAARRFGTAHSASGSGTTPVSTAMRSSSGLASQVAW